MLRYSIEGMGGLDIGLDTKEITGCETSVVYYEFKFFIRIDAIDIIMNNILNYSFIGFI